MCRCNHTESPLQLWTRPELKGTFGMVASTHWLGTAAGMSILEKGGNAFDSAVATGLTLQVVEPSMAGPAGDAPIIFYDAEADQVQVICGQGVAPEKATIGAFRELGLEIVPGAPGTISSPNSRKAPIVAFSGATP